MLFVVMESEQLVVPGIEGVGGGGGEGRWNGLGGSAE
jgi:hypothetical protein